MKKFLLSFLISFFLSVNAETLKAGISEDVIPKGFFGSWAVVSILKSTDNPAIFNYQSKDIWNLSSYGDILILENLESGARSEIVVKEKNKDGKTLKFNREKTVKSYNEKVIFKETVTFVLNGNKFSGNDEFAVERYDLKGNLLLKNRASYSVSGVKFAGD